MSNQKYASLAVEDLKEGSNLFDNVDATITKAVYTNEAPDNYTAEGTPIFAVISLELKGDAPIEERTVSQSYSLGASAGANFTVSDDGFGLIPNEDGVSLRKDSKWGTFVSALANEGLPKPILQSGDVSKFVGLVGHFTRVADKERNFVNDSRKQKSKFPPSTLVCTKIHSLPGAVVATKASSKPAGGAAPVANDSDFDTVVGGYLMTVLEKKAKEGKSSVQRSTLGLLLSQAAAKEERRQDIARRGADEGFLATLVEAGMINYDASAKPQVVSIA
jgi:hypothetical protein